MTGVNAKAVAVKVVTHRDRDAKGRKLGHVGYVQRRAPSKVARFGGKRFAAWAVLTADGVEVGTPERYASFDKEEDAIARAVYAASRAP